MLIGAEQCPRASHAPDQTLGSDRCEQANLSAAGSRKTVCAFIVVNDGEAEANPRVEDSHLFINGVEPKDWVNVIINGLRSPSFWALPPHQVLSFGYQLGPGDFSKPGIYTLRWEGRNFSSATVTFRVLPEGNWY